MKMKRLITVTALALAAISLVSSTASAANVSASAGDLILGFRVDDGAGTGASSNLEIDLGSYTNFTTPTATTSFATVVGADLTSTYGSNWATRTDIVWNVAGTAGAGNAIDVTDNSVALGGSPTTFASLATPKALVAAEIGGLNGQPNTGDSTKAAVIGNTTTPANTITGSYAYEVNGGSSGNPDYNSFNPGETEYPNTAGTDGTLELYNFTTAAGGTANDLGTFSLTGSGSSATFTYTGVSAPASVPEPSTFAMGISGLLLLWVLRRRNAVV